MMLHHITSSRLKLMLTLMLTAATLFHKCANPMQKTRDVHMLISSIVLSRFQTKMTKNNMQDAQSTRLSLGTFFFKA